MNLAAAVVAARDAAAIFPLDRRAIIEVRGADRVRFLQGQLTNDVAALDAAGRRAGCHALALTREGRIVAEFHVVARADAFWLETDADTAQAAIERLAKYVVADDVAIADVTTTFARFAVEGPRAQALVGVAAGEALALAPEDVAALRVGGASVIAAAWSFGGGPALQLFVPARSAAEVHAALRDAGRAFDAIEAGDDALETLRIEAGIPRAGAELGPETLPAELGLVERAVSFTKGCFTGQEVVTRMHSRGRVGHLLVGVSLGERSSLPAPRTPVEVGGAKVGEITSAVFSPRAGAIALAIVRKGFDAPDTELDVAGRRARIVSLPFVPIPDAP